MKILLAVALGGALGSLGRYGFGVLALRWLGTGFPWGTLGVNVIGGFVMGVIVELSALKLNLDPAMRAFLTVGILGGFTTFSAFSLDAALMIEKHQNLAAAIYILSSMCLSIGALFAGLKLVRMAVL